MEDPKQSGGENGENSAESLEDKLREALNGMISDIDMSEFNEYEEDVEEENTSKSADEAHGNKEEKQFPNDEIAIDQNDAFAVKHSVKIDMQNGDEFVDFYLGDDDGEDIRSNVLGKEEAVETHSTATMGHTIAVIITSVLIWLLILIGIGAILKPVAQTDDTKQAAFNNENTVITEDSNSEFLFGEPYIEGYLVPSKNEHYVEPIGDNRIGFVIATSDGHMYAVETCSCEYGEHYKHSELQTRRYKSQGIILNGVSFVKAQDGQAPYARVWTSRFSDVFAQITMTQDDMDYLMDDLVERPWRYSHDTGDITDMGDADTETQKWLNSIIAEEENDEALASAPNIEFNSDLTVIDEMEVSAENLNKGN